MEAHLAGITRGLEAYTVRIMMHRAISGFTYLGKAINFIEDMYKLVILLVGLLGFLLPLVLFLRPEPPTSFLVVLGPTAR